MRKDLPETNEVGSIIIYSACRNRCVFCLGRKDMANDEYFGEVTDKEAVDRQVESDVLQNIAGGFKKIEISGGDALSYWNIVSVIKKLKGNGAEFIAVSADGRRLHDMAFARALKDAGLSKVRIPFYGSNPEVHEKVTHEANSFNEVLQGIQNAKELGLIIEATTLVLKQNKDDFLNIIRLLSEYATYIGIAYPHAFTAEQLSRNALRFSEIRKEILGAIEYCKEKNMPLAVRSIPFCIFGKRYPNMECGYNAPKKPTGAHYDELKSHEQVYHETFKEDSCKECIYDLECSGPLKMYVELFGFGEFVPVKKP